VNLDDTSPSTTPEPIVGVLRRHRLTQFRALGVGCSIVDARMAAACDSNHCGSTCCGTGVWADQAEHDRILEHASAVVAVMDPDQPRDPRDWFDDERRLDSDFPSGVAIGTRTAARGCIFLDAKGRCVLQKATAEGLAPVVLKPFYCFAFPITIDRGTLMVDIDNVEGTTRCCVPVAGGPRTILEAFAWELEHVLGKDGFDELRSMLAARDRAP
jgi:hypothetical protein